MSAIPGSFAVTNVYVKAIFCEISLKTPTVCDPFGQQSMVKWFY